MKDLITFETLPNWVPGRLLLASDGLGWKNVARLTGWKLRCLHTKFIWAHGNVLGIHGRTTTIVSSPTF